ncbi:MAG: hypothetical protein ACE14S_02900 [Candidatus Bathyarchaeia archaeon]
MKAWNKAARLLLFPAAILAYLVGWSLFWADQQKQQARTKISATPIGTR